MPSTFPFSVVSVVFLGLLFLTLRKETVGNGLQKSLLCVFVGHNCLCAGISIKQFAVLPDGNSRMGFDIILVKLVMIFGVIQNFVGAFVGIVALHVSDSVLDKRID